MSIHFLSGQLEGEERKEIIQEVQQQLHEAVIGAIRPRLQCQCCGHDVVCTSTILEKYQRFWLDLDQRVQLCSGLCQRLRHLSQEWSATLNSQVGLRTIVLTHQSDRALTSASAH